MTSTPSRPHVPLRARSAGLRTALLAGGWWIVTEGDRSAVAFGVPLVLLALGASLSLSPAPAPRWSATGLARFVVVFVAGSLLGGVDVARRALAPTLPIAPGMMRFPLRLRTSPARRLFMCTLSLMPGTLCVSQEGDELLVHVLSDEGDGRSRTLRALEAHVARAVGEPLEERHA